MGDSKQQAYKNDFEKFLAHTNEKKILLSEIVSEIEKRQVKSMLDIGAGNGLLSIPLSKHVVEYLAVEPTDSFVETLKSAGLETIHGSFPMSIVKRFDMVLTSHSVSFLRDRVEAFVRSAFEHVNESGVLLIVTYSGKEGPWGELIRKLDQEQSPIEFIEYKELLTLVETIGKVDVRKVKTTVETDTLEDMIDALTFIASNGIPELKAQFLMKKEQIVDFLGSYKKGTGYVFPFLHYFVVVSK